VSQPEPENASDSLLGASFASYIEHQEALSILQKYQKGFQVTLIKGWGARSDAPTYRAVIYKLIGDVAIGGAAPLPNDYYEWQTEGLSATLLNALKGADKRAQERLQNPPQA
jgi:hypothetical protein